ncbi:EAL domain-containing protein [Pseudomonas otitidis]|uniref:bifunctional diguanylate cyclase/phosphodiesterase n=1 Tax=Metapseudomonas otitidis TaxID=319939 RepID=UPI00244B8F2B|nr:bifunctional diguanylate cyclase/phosphodiesterase [Pseudomonas otitidis]MDH1108075.1 EAL domain-containing protein [Pseudomonas otitidis]MDH1158662.1 EAL domain-containing protein [Pseudomonas otitidis]MDH1167058.1 EAL domain-containing protein [Pseudomonas otitidis]
MARLSAIFVLCLSLWMPSAGALTLTQEEQDWLQAHPTLRIGIDASWPPFEFRDSQGRHQGLAADYTRLIQDRLNIRLDPIDPGNWSEVLERAKRNEVDLLPGIMSTPERQGYLNFTRPYLDFPIVILAREDGATPKTLDDLYGLKVVVVENYAPHELLHTHNPDLNLLTAPTVAAALQALATGKADAFVSDLASSVWSLRQLKLEGLFISGETPYRYQLAMATPKSEPILIGILDKVFAELTPEQMNAIQDRWVGGVIDRRPVWTDQLIYVIPALFGALLVLVFVLRINRRLRGEMSRRALLEEEIRNSEQHYRGLVESLNAIAWEMSLDNYCFTYVSPHAERLLGYPLDEWKKPGFWQRTLHPEDAEHAQHFCLEETQAGRDHSFDYRMLAADGRILWIRDIVTLIHHGHVPVIRGLMIDITEAKHTEEALRLSEQKFATVFHHCPDVIALARRSDGRILDVNQTFEQQTGLSAAQAIGRTATELGLWTDPSLAAGLLQRLQHESLHNLEMAFRRSDGRNFTGLLSAQPTDVEGVPALIIVVRDITVLQETQQRLRLSEEKFARAFHASPDGLLITRLADGRLIEANEGFTRITGYELGEADYRTTLDLGIWERPSDRTYMVKTIREEGGIRDFTAPIRRKDGSLRICELSAQPLPVAGETCILTIARDVTDRQKMQEELLQAATVFESTAEGVMITDTQQRILAVNRAFTTITGYEEHEALGQTPRLLASNHHERGFYVDMWDQLNREGHWQGEIWNRRKNGETFPEWLTINAVRNPEGQITHFVGVFADISPLKQAQARLDYQAHHDPLTGLPNRILFENRLRQALAACEREGHEGAVLFLDLDRFKHINDSLGHPIGDVLLKSIADRLGNQLGRNDTVARLGGDEFIILLPHLRRPEEAQHLAERLLACFTAPFETQDHEFFISASIGISRFPEHGSDTATLVKNADAAMYQAKSKGRNRVELYTRDLTFQATERMALENELRRALERNELCLYYQPKLCLHSGCLIGAEALLRWQHPLFGDISPDRFIPLAEENGFILTLGDWVISEACRQMREWQDQHAPFGPLSVNLAGAQLHQPGIVQRIDQQLRSAGIPAERLQLEITETFIMSQAEEALAVLHALKDLGLQLAIDDFGTGYSSLSYLKRLPLDIIKIDKSFVRGLPHEQEDAAIARAIIALGHSMQLTVIAEGVETPAQEAFLRAEGCEQIQGYIVSRPLPAEVFARQFLSPSQTVGAPDKAPV